MEGPSKLLLSLEAARGIYEYGVSWALSMPLQFISPKGDGHPVIVIPGLGGADGTTQYIRTFINKIGYKAYPWGLGRNLGPRRGLDHLLNQLVERVSIISNDSGDQQVTLIGWSLGGVYSREIAKACPHLVRQVITMGTPFKEGGQGTNAAKLYEFLSKDTSHKDPDIIKRISQPPPVPFTSIYSKTDGVVHWESSIESEGPISENIEIPGASHLGLGHNPIAMYVVADRLTQSKDSWKPYKSR